MSAKIRKRRMTTARKKGREIIAILYETNPRTGKPLEVNINDGSIDFGKVKDEKARLFCYFYTLYGTPSYHNASESYRKTGTKCKNSQSLAKTAYEFRKKHPEIEEFITNFEEKQIKTDIKEAKNAILRMKLKQAMMNPKNFLENKKRRTKDGDEYTTLDLKDIDDISDEDAITYINKIDMKGSDGKIVYELIDKAKIQNEIIALADKDNNGDSSDGMEIETTAEIIKGNLQLKTKIIQNNKKIGDSIDYVQGARTSGDTDLESLEED